MQKKERSAFPRILLSYLSVLAIPICICLIIYYSAVSSVTKIVRDYSRSMLDQMISNTDTRLQELEPLSFYLKSSSDMLRLLGRQEIAEGSAEFYDVYKTYIALPKFSLSSAMVEDVQVVMLKNKFVISESSALRLDDRTYQALFPYSGMEYDEFWELLNSRFFYNSFMQFTAANGKVTPVFLSSIDYNDSGKPLAVAIIRLKPTAISGMLSELLLSPGDLAVVLDEHGGLIAASAGKQCELPLEQAVEFISAENETQNEYEGYIVSMVESGYNNWRYCVFSPRGTVLAEVRRTQGTALVLILIAVVMSVGFAYALSRHKAGSLKKIIHYLNGKTEKSALPSNNEYSPIVSAASDLMDSRQKLTTLMQQQKPLWDATVLRNLLVGDIYRTGDICYLFELMNIKPEGQKYAVVLISADLGYGGLPKEYINYPALMSAAITSYVSAFGEIASYCLDIDSSRKAVIAVVEDKTDKEFSDVLRNFCRFVHKKTLAGNGIYLTLCISNTCDVVDDIHNAFQQVNLISQQSSAGSAQYIYTSDDILEIQKLYYYPVKTELALIKLIRQGNSEELAILLEHIKEENFAARSLSNSMRQQLVFAVRGSILRGIADVEQSGDIHGFIAELNTAVSLEALSAAAMDLCNAFGHISSTVAMNKKENEKQAVLKYISTHYTESDFSIYHVCEEFHISESLAYQLFRETIGTSFADLIESKRIEKACRMLAGGNTTIKEIALQVGYTSDNSFRRAFKRVMGITPSEYVDCQ